MIRATFPFKCQRKLEDINGVQPATDVFIDKGIVRYLGCMALGSLSLLIVLT